MWDILVFKRRYKIKFQNQTELILWSSLIFPSNWANNLTLFLTISSTFLCIYKHRTPKWNLIYTLRHFSVKFNTKVLNWTRSLFWSSNYSITWSYTRNKKDYLRIFFFNLKILMIYLNFILFPSGKWVLPFFFFLKKRRNVFRFYLLKQDKKNYKIELWSFVT